MEMDFQKKRRFFVDSYTLCPSADLIIHFFIGHKRSQACEKNRIYVWNVPLLPDKQRKGVVILKTVDYGNYTTGNNSLVAAFYSGTDHYNYT
jgi:hypothetical protein